MAECVAGMRLDFPDGSLAYLTCNLDDGDEHKGLNHHDGTYGIWWARCSLEDHGHADPDNEGERVRPDRAGPDCPECGFGLPRHDRDCTRGRIARRGRLCRLLGRSSG